MFNEHIIHDDIIKLVNKYAKSDKRMVFDDKMKAILYDFDLGGRKAGIVYCPSKFIIGGISNLTPHGTNKLKRKYKEVLKLIEEDIISWRKEHGGIV